VIADKLVALEKAQWKRADIAPGEPRIVYLQSHVRTRQWFKNGKTFVRTADEDSSYAAPKTVRRTRNLG
jgi:DNA (cytosine-5)-methyltransferase 1